MLLDGIVDIVSCHRLCLSWLSMEILALLFFGTTKRTEQILANLLLLQPSPAHVPGRQYSKWPQQVTRPWNQREETIHSGSSQGTFGIRS